LDTRKQLVAELLKGERPPSEILPALSRFGWDSERPLVTLTSTHVAEVLRRYLQGTLTASQVEEWANAVEGREDVDYIGEEGDVLREAVHELANPLLTRELSPATAQDWLIRLGHA
jgi:hypothetical protein